MPTAHPGEPQVEARPEHPAAGWTPVDTCPLCGSQPGAHHAFATHVAGDSIIRYVLCKRCGLVFQSPRPSQEWLDRLYQHEYRQRRHSQERDPAKDRWVQERRAQHLAEVLRSHRPRFRRHLDFGCSSGALLSAFTRQFGGAGFGVEPGEADRAQANAAGLQVAARLEQLPRETAGTFDLVTLSHVLEHLPDPVGTLSLIRREWMAADGIVLIESPNLYGHTSFELGHVTAFTRPTLQGVLSAAGLELVAFRRHGQPYSRLLPLFLLVIARAAPDSLSPRLPTARIRWTRFRRWLGLLQLRAARLASRLLLGRRRLQPWME